MTPEIQSSIEVIYKWLANIEIPQPQKSGLSKDEKKQLLVVNRSIEQLKKLRVSIPDDLRHLKLELSARDTEVSSNPKFESTLEALESLIKSLNKLSTQAKKTKSQFKSPKGSSEPKKHYGISLEDLIEYGHINQDSRLELQWLKDGDVFEGQVQPNGMIAVRTQSGWKSFKSLSTAASELAGSSLNGWKHWFLVEPNGKRTPLAEIRKCCMKD